MSDLFFETMQRLEPVLARGHLATCELEVGKVLRSLPPTPFHDVLDMNITNDPEEAAEFFDQFFRLQAGENSLAAAYTEMNGFDINPDSWYCNVFGYEKCQNLTDLDWLSDYQTGPSDEYVIKGLESLQEIYASKAFNARQNNDASYICSLMVLVKFQKFMQRAARLMKELEFPLYVTAHEFTFIAEFRPKE